VSCRTEKRMASYNTQRRARDGQQVARYARLRDEADPNIASLIQAALAL